MHPHPAELRSLIVLILEIMVFPAAASTILSKDFLKFLSVKFLSDDIYLAPALLTCMCVLRPARCAHCVHCLPAEPRSPAAPALFSHVLLPHVTCPAPQAPPCVEGMEAATEKPAHTNFKNCNLRALTLTARTWQRLSATSAAASPSSGALTSASAPTVR